MKYRLLAILIFAVQIGFGQIYIDSYRFATTPTNLLLDDYPGAAAAYSVRKLDKDYTGNAMLIRRSSDGSTQNIGFSGNDLDEAAINTFCSGTTCTVQTWYDQSGNGYDATQTTAANQPTIYTGGAVTTISGIPAVLWPNYSNAYWLRSTSFNLSQPNTIFSAFYFNGTSGRQDFLFDSNNDATNRHILWHDLATNRWGSFAGSILQEPSADLIARKLIFTQLYNTSSSFIRKNGSQTVSGNVGNATMNGITIGNYLIPQSLYNHSGSIFEIIIYPTNRTDFSLIESNINSYYSIY